MMTMATTKQQATNDQQESGSVKEIATDKMSKVITIEPFCRLKKVKLVVYYKIIWQIVIMVKTLKMAY